RDSGVDAFSLDSAGCLLEDVVIQDEGAGELLEPTLYVADDHMSDGEGDAGVHGIDFVGVGRPGVGPEPKGGDESCWNRFHIFSAVLVRLRSGEGQVGRRRFGVPAARRLAGDGAAVFDGILPAARV